MRPQLLKTRHFQHNWPLVPPLSARICALEKILCQNIVDLRITEIVSSTPASSLPGLQEFAEHRHIVPA